MSSPVRDPVVIPLRFAACLRAALRVVTFGLAAMVCVAAQTTTVGPPIDAARVVQFLDQTIAWHQAIGEQQQLVSDANDAVYVSANRQMADEVVRLGFQFARAQAGAGPTAGADQQAAGVTSPPLLAQESEAQKDQAQVEGEVVDLQRKLAAASGKQKDALQAQLAETQAEVDLAKARVDAIDSMVRFASNARTGATGLSAQIDALESTLPPDLRIPAANESASGRASGGTTTAIAQPTAASSAVQAPVASPAAGSGLWESATRIVSTWSKLRSIEAAVQQTQALEQAARDLRAPQIAALKALTARGDELAHQADTAGTATLGQERQQLDAVTRQFRQLTGSAIPLAQAGILLGLYEKNLASWQASVGAELRAHVWGFAARLAGVGLLVGLVLGASALWRRAIARYVHDTRRRWQLHWVRKFVVWAAIATIVTFSFVSQIGSMATFAGLITAGVAVSLQNVIQSMVGYFFLIGKYGIRAGDRVMIGGVSGEVIDVGLVRIHLMEMGGAAADTPTGRIVAFSNSIVFQATPGLFKQIPGTSFGWHEITLTLPAEMNLSSARERLMRAVEAGLAEFKDEITKQHSAIEDAFDSRAGTGLQPTAQLQFSASGLEAMVRYPVALRHATNIDDAVTRALLTEFDLTHPGSPPVRLKTGTAGDRL